MRNTSTGVAASGQHRSVGAALSAACGRAILAAAAVTATIAAPSVAQSATYYVDATAGSDSAAGTSPAAAWRNAPGMQAYAGSGRLAPGDTVYFDRGDVWAVTGTQGIYLVGGVTYVGNEWGSGTRATLRASADLASAVVRFSDHPTLPTIMRGFDVDANRKVANGIEMNHSFYAGPLTGATKRVDDAVVRNVWSRASLGQYKYGIIISNHGGTNGEVANVEILNSTVHDISRDGLPIYPGDENAQCIVRNVLVRNNVVYNTGQDPDYGAGSGIIVKGHVINAVVEFNHVHSTKGAGIFVNGNETNHFNVGPTEIQIRHNLVAVDTVHGSIRLYDGSSGKDPKDVTIFGNIVYGNRQGGGLVIDPDLGNRNRVLVYNNTFVDAPVTVNNTAATFSALEFRNNAFVHSTGIPFSDNGRTTAHSNNLYFGPGVRVRSAGRSFDAAALTTYEPTAQGGDPRFEAASSRPTGFRRNAQGQLAPDPGGFAPASGSPLVDRGTALSSTYSSSIAGVQRPAGANWDIGAYEVGGSSRPSPPANLTVTP
jgi:hypothetical protein